MNLKGWWTMNMTSVTDLQIKYVDMDEHLRQYTWDFDTVESLAELEIDVYEAFPDIEKVKADFNKLYSNVKEYIEDDEPLKNTIENFKKELFKKDTTFYFKLNQVKEVLK